MLLMGKISTVCLLALIIARIESVNAIQKFSVPKYLEKRDQSRLIRSKQLHQGEDDQAHNAEDDDDVDELFLEQRLNHFSSSGAAGKDAPPLTFFQRYFYTDRYVSTPTNQQTEVTSSSSIKTTTSTDQPRSNLRPSVHKEKDNENDETVIYAFLCMGGEGPDLDKSVLTNSVHCSGDMIELASILHKERDMDVHLFALEHRYYGKSYPDFGAKSSPVSNENLKYLSSRQALSDMAHFVTYQNQQLTEKYNIATNTTTITVKWITFGGSYPGMLAAWARLKFPHLIYAAVSNSAPVQVAFDFPEYKQVLGNDISGTTNNGAEGGSAQCWDVVRQGHEFIHQLLSVQDSGTDASSEEGREQIAELFGICGGPDELKVERNVQSFLGDGVIDIDVQDNDPNCVGELCNIEKLCNNITNSELSPMETLAAVSQFQSKGNCKNINWSEVIDYLSSDEAQQDGDRSWLFQTCTEVGFYQTCYVNSTCPFGQGYHLLDMDLEICAKAFEITGDGDNENYDATKKLVEQNVQETLEYYGGWNMQSSRILSVNGDIDPWSAMSMNVKENSDETNGRNNDEKWDMPTYWSYGASHHFWTHDLKKDDGGSIMKTREVIYDWVINLIDGPEEYERGVGGPSSMDTADIKSEVSQHNLTLQNLLQSE